MLLTLAVSYLGMIQDLEEEAEQREVSDGTEPASTVPPGGYKGQKTNRESCRLFE